jgi:non-heme chloroperoxidase
MMTAAKAHYDCIKVLSETEFDEDLSVIDVPVLAMHGHPILGRHTTAIR